MLHLSFLRSVWIEREGRGMEGSRVKLAEKKMTTQLIKHRVFFFFFFFFLSRHLLYREKKCYTSPS